MAWIDNLFRRMADMGASDLHMTSEHVPKLRVSGDITDMPGIPLLSKEQMRQILLEICPERNQAQFDETGDTDFAYALPGVARFRCNYFNDRFGPGAVFRRIPDTILTADQLGLPPAVMKLTEYKKGLVLVTGPTGSGNLRPWRRWWITSMPAAPSTSSPLKIRLSSSIRRSAA